MPNSLHNAASESSLREQLAKLEHEQWCEWSRSLAATETLSEARLESWKGRWIPYVELSEADKELDRKYADLVLAVLREARLSVEDASGGASP
jgi:hypothetical protein